MAKVNIICHYKCRKNTRCQKFCARMWNPYFFYFFTVLTTRNNIFQLLDQPKSYGNAALNGFTAFMTSIESGTCVQPHTLTLTIPVDPGPGPDLIQIHIYPQPFWRAVGIWDQNLAGYVGWAVAGGHLPKNFVMDRVNTRFAHNNYVTCSYTALQKDLQKAMVSTALPLHPRAIIEILCQVHPFWMQVVVFLKLQMKILTLCTKGSATAQMITNKPSVKQLSDHKPSVLTLSYSPPHVYLSLMASTELHGLGRVLSSGLSRINSAQLSPRQQGRKLFM